MIRKITPDNTLTTVAGTGEAGFKDGLQTEAQFSFPYGLALDDKGVLYIVDAGRIRKLDKNGNVTTVAGTGDNATSDGSGETAKFSNPTAIAIDNCNNLYISQLDGYIRKISLPDKNSS